MGIYSNRGKESALIDVKTAKGRDILARLIECIDIITINASKAQLPALGLTFDEIQRRNPGAILCHLDAFGGPNPGPRSEYPGYDDLVQASTGVMERFGGSLSTVEEHAHFGTIDVLGGLCAALAASMALLRREETGKGDIARSSLAAAGQWIQARFMYDFAERPPFDEPRGRDAKGEGPFYRCYQASDGWFFLAVRPNQRVVAASRLLGAVEPTAVPLIESRLEGLFKTQPVRHWQRELRDLDIGIQQLKSLSAIREASLAQPGTGRTVRFIRETSHPLGRPVEHVEPTAIRSRHAPVLSLPPAAKYGAGSRSVMRELGYSDVEIAALVAERVIADSWSDEYLPD
jgi:crotonobetainyl-CoA:carnitine CoA-transferase CaiB-like acyl-CoA transferase